MSKHTMLMLLGCLLPLIVLLLLPTLGISGDLTFLVLIILAAICLIPMLMMRYRKNSDKEDKS